MSAIEPLGPMVRMRAIRQVKGWTQQFTAERMAEQGYDVTAAGVSNVESGNKQASERFLIAWALAFGLEPMDVWHGPLRRPTEPSTPSNRIKSERLSA